MNRHFALTALVAALALSACASSPAPRFYRLAPMSTTAAPAARSSDRSVIIGPFELAEYLARPQIVTRDGASAVTVAHFQRWAEPLDASLQGIVAANVGHLIGSDHVLEFPAQTILKPDRRVTGRVARLDVEAGTAVLEVQWGVLNGDGSVAQPGRRSHYEAKVAGEGYAAMVAAMSETVAKFSEDVATAVR
jgi:uncharacterized lipoprotein YmbA